MKLVTSRTAVTRTLAARYQTPSSETSTYISPRWARKFEPMVAKYRGHSTRAAAPGVRKVISFCSRKPTGVSAKNEIVFDSR